MRSGKKSYRFEVRLGDCGKDSGHDDCKKDRQRTELQFKKYQMGKKRIIGILHLFIFQMTINQ